MSDDIVCACRGFATASNAKAANTRVRHWLIARGAPGQISGYLMEAGIADGSRVYCVALIGPKSVVDVLISEIGGREFCIPDDEVARMFARRQKQMRIAKETDAAMVITPLHDGARLTDDGDLEDV